MAAFSVHKVLSLPSAKNQAFMDPNGGKKGLYNKYGREDLIRQLEAEDFKRKTISFYRYVIIDDPQTMRDQLYIEWSELKCLGRIYVAQEGINAQMNVPEYNWEAFVEKLYAHPEFVDIPFKIAVEDDGKSFLKLTIKVRKQIVADGLKPEDYDVTDVGRHLTADEWNAALEGGATVVDMRNHYESEIGHFENSILPEAETFRDELPMVLDKLKGMEEEKILLYCTGGIRCEKTSAYLKHHGFKDVNQLHGGIIDYHRQIETKQLPNKFHGVNFVFDERLGENISGEVISRCHQCGQPSAQHVNCANKACNLLFIQCPDCAEEHLGTCSPTCMEIVQLPEEKQKELRKGVENKKRYHSHEKVDLTQAFEH
jgi:UPF0176 protein